MKNEELNSRYRALKCQHTETIPTVLDTYGGGKAVCYQCVQCGAGIKEVRKSKSGLSISELPPFDHDFKETQRQARKELRISMWKEATQ